MTKSNNNIKKITKHNSRLRIKICPICKLNSKRYSSSSLGRHIRTVHGNKWQCSYCHTFYADKNSHKYCFEKEKHLLLNFIEGFTETINSSNKYELHPSNLNLSFIFEQKDDIYFSRKLLLGYGHFSNVFYGIHQKIRFEVAFKTPKNIEKSLDYKNEAFILKKLEGPNFYPKLIGYDESLIHDCLPISLLGPSLKKFHKFYEKSFDKKTIINIAFNLFNQIEYLYSKNILHRDIKPDNIAFGLIKASEFRSKKLYLIDYGFSIYMDKNFREKKSISSSWRNGTTKYMSINTHRKIKPTVLDDIESLLYCLMELGGIKLPWDGLKISNYQINNIYSDIKENMNFVKECGEEFGFISKIFYYLNKLKRNEVKLNFNVIKEILFEEEKKTQTLKYKENFCFIEFLKQKLNLFIKSKNTVPNDLALLKLFHSYPINFNKLYESILKKENI